MFNDTFYPTPPDLIEKMMGKISGGYDIRILEPSAGSGAIANALCKEYAYRDGSRLRRDHIFVMEIDETLQATLRGEGFKILDSDFLAFGGPDRKFSPRYRFTKRYGLHRQWKRELRIMCGCWRKSLD